MPREPTALSSNLNGKKNLPSFSLSAPLLTMKNHRRKQTFLGSAIISLLLCSSLDLGFFAAREGDSPKLEVKPPVAMASPGPFPIADKSRRGRLQINRSEPSRRDSVNCFYSVICCKIVSSLYDREAAPSISQQFGCPNKTNGTIMLVDMPTWTGKFHMVPLLEEELLPLDEVIDACWESKN